MGITPRRTSLTKRRRRPDATTCAIRQARSTRNVAGRDPYAASAAASTFDLQIRCLSLKLLARTANPAGTQSHRGADQLRYIYERLPRYFPQLTGQDLDERAKMASEPLGALRPARRPPARRERRIAARKDQWKITARGLKCVDAEAMTLTRPPSRSNARKKRSRTRKLRRCWSR